MSKFFSRIDDSRGGFFDPAVHGEIGSPGCTIPAGAKEITDKQHAELMAAVDNGKLIVPDADGFPVAIEPLPASAEEQAQAERAWRDTQLAATDGVVSRHRDEVEVGGGTTLTAEQYAELQAYRQELRKWPQGEEFPLVDHRPVAPTWLVDGEVLL